MESRLNKLRRKFRALGVSNFVLAKFSDIHHEQSSNIAYLCGFTGSNALLLVTGKEAYLLTDGRYTNQAASEVKGAKVFIYSSGNSIADAFVRELKENKEIRFRGRIGFEVGRVTVDMHQCFSRAFPNSPLIELRDVVEHIAAIKDASEIAATRKACAITDKVFESLLGEIKPGVAEADLSAEVTYRHKKFGAERDAFEPIVASGERSALPHGRASSKKLQKGDFVTFDIGCVADGYTSDMTRTVVIGKASAEQKKIYHIVAEAQRRAAEEVKPGADCAVLDLLARNIITDAGYGDNFTHSLGHGIGREVHAFPRLFKASKDKLETGMIITIEPGIYIGGFGGVRIEDDVVVTTKGGEILNRSPKLLIEL
jgi:Xaa-Pro aminopeptidase